MKTRVFRILVVIFLMISFFTPKGQSVAAPNAQETTPAVKAARLLEKMTPSEKVGQLFLVTFTGTITDESSHIHKLINEQHIGGVVLRADNDNFIGPESTASAAHEMITSLQRENWSAAQVESISEDGTPVKSTQYAPLLVGISQEGDLGPYDQIMNGLTPLPTEMAIGATWDTANAQAAGQILGSELRVLGINLLFGPSLDVLDLVKTDVGEDLGVRTFGGDPYWVAKMGQSYIKGVHEGSDNTIAVISTHFPGRGGSDRQPEDEVATVRKSLEQLKQIELAPFFAVTKQNEDISIITDGLLLSHIRYQGFQGNIRATTRPVSFDSAALDQLMSLSEFATWQQNGGIIVSDDLGSSAVKKFFDPSSTGFDARQVIKSALLAGNDLLYTGNIVATGDADTYTTIVRTHEYFVQKYIEDSAFQQRVDEAVLRVLTLKYKLYPEFTYSALMTSAYELTSLDTSGQMVFDIASQAVTLVSPDLTELDTVLPEPPQNNERIVFISDSITQQQCSTCADQNVFLADNLRKAVERLYGPQAGEQIQTYKLSAYSFESLELLLENNNPPENLRSDLESASWLVISFTEFQKSSYSSEIFHRFFSEKADLTRNKKIIGFAFNAPYYLDATDISKFTAYYAVYSKIPVFVDVAARILFQEIVPTGILPVSVSSVGYDLITATTPDPDQVIPLMVESANPELTSTETATANANISMVYKVGDSIPLCTGMIVDHNGNPVPDGTVVRFLIDTRSTSGSIEQIETQTVDGVARTVYRIQNLGVYNLSVSADPATVSQILNLDISEIGGQIVSLQPTLSPTETEVSSSTPEVVLIPEENEPTNHEQGLPSAGDWLLSTLLILAIASMFFWWGWRRQKFGWNPRIPFLVGVCGYLAYLYFVIGLPGSKESILSSGGGVVALWVMGGCVLGGGIGILWYALERYKKS